MMIDKLFILPIEAAISSRATRATPGGSLRERLAAARQKPVVTIPEPEPVVETAEPESRIINRTMESKVFGGRVELVFNLDEPDQAMVDGVQYANDELKGLLSGGLNRDEIRDTHEVKRAFGGAVVVGLDEQRRERG